MQYVVELAWDVFLVSFVGVWVFLLGRMIMKRDEKREPGFNLVDIIGEGQTETKSTAEEVDEDAEAWIARVPKIQLSEEDHSGYFEALRSVKHSCVLSQGNLGKIDGRVEELEAELEQLRERREVELAKLEALRLACGDLTYLIGEGIDT